MDLRSKTIELQNLQSKRENESSSNLLDFPFLALTYDRVLPIPSPEASLLFRDAHIRYYLAPDA